MSSKRPEQIHALLQDLRDNPADNETADNILLQKVYDALTKTSQLPGSKEIHWFCDKVPTDTVECASFLLRLYAFNGPSAEEWKKGYRRSLRGCTQCVANLEHVKVSSRSTYFAAYDPKVLDVFFAGLDAWELDTLLEDLRAKGITAGNATTVSEIPSPLLYRMLANWRIFSNSTIQTLIHAFPPSQIAADWPPNEPPPGILILLMDSSQQIRDWARRQAFPVEPVPMHPERFIPSYANAFRAAAEALNSTQSAFSFSSDRQILWAEFTTLLRLAPIKQSAASNLQPLDLRHAVTGHLQDPEPHFSLVLKSFVLLLKKLSSDFWAGEVAELAEVVFASIKDNQTFLYMLQDVHTSRDKLWMLTWIPEFLHTISNSSIYGEMLAKTVDFLCEETQHERFRDARPVIMNSGLQLLASVIRRQSKDENNSLKGVLRTILDIHSRVIVAVAYDSAYSSEIWKPARVSARSLVDALLTTDGTRIHGTILRLCQAVGKVKLNVEPEPIPDLHIHTSIWRAVYSAIRPKDTEAIANMLRIGARNSHMSTLLKEPYCGTKKDNTGKREAFGKVVDQINSALHDVQTGFLDTISRFANYTVSSSSLELLSLPDVAKSVVTLLLSPVAEYQVAAQTIIGLAFEVDVRAECLRTMFTNLPEATFDGLVDFLSRFQAYASRLPEARDLSKSLVRCFNDVLEVLCSSPDGLLLNKEFLKPKDPQGPRSRLLEFWINLNQSITVIFKRTVPWAFYYQPHEMVEWMRDAIILGRDMIKQWRVIESAANQDSGRRPKKLSEVGEKMVSGFQDMLPELSKWLRLTDEELLYQAFAIFRSLLQVLKETDKRPHDQTLEKLNRYVTGAKTDKSKSRLDAASLIQLEEALAAFDQSSDSSESESDDEIEIIAHKKATISKPPKAMGGLEPEQKKLTHQQQMAQLNKHALKGKYQPASKPIFSKKAMRDDEAKIRADLPIANFRRTTHPTASTSKVPMTKPAKVDRKSEGESDAASSSESEGLQRLAALVPKSPKIRKVERKRQIQMLDPPNTGRKSGQGLFDRKPQQNPALRLRPNISTLHNSILDWNYEDDGPLPPRSENLKLDFIPGEFRDYDQYRSILEPLLLMECWAQITQTKREALFSLPCTITERSHLSKHIKATLDIRGTPPSDWDLSEVDIVLITTPDKQKPVIAHVSAFNKAPMGVSAKVTFSESRDGEWLYHGSACRVSKLFSLSTVNREYAALLSLPHLRLLDSIIHPRVATTPSFDPKELQQVMETQSLNKPQAAAIVGAMKTEGFVLIQGPPGTGKTSTICALVSRFMSQRPHKITIPGKIAQKGETEEPKKKILICAPSNAAIDEIAQRLLAKVSGLNQSKKLNILRIGPESKMNAPVKVISMDALVRRKIANKTGNQGSSLEELNRQIKAMYLEMDSLKRLREEVLKELADLQDNFSRKTSLEGEAQSLGMKRRNLATKLNELKDRVKSENRNLDGLRRQMRREVIQEADVVCSTLSGSGHDSLIEEQFEMVIIDEAAQAIELSSLIPLKYNSTRCIMVGDPQQLPPTVISQEATRRNYNQSLFLRLYNKCPDSVHLLSIQYRMHPEISRFPSRAFYEGRIEDGPNMKELTTRPWHAQPVLGIFKFYNIKGNEDFNSFNSYRNVKEVKAAKALYTRLRREFKNLGMERRIGIVTMYNAQLQELRHQFTQEFGASVLDDVDFNTVDGFQGQEKDIIILSCVRAGPGVQRIGFLADVRRINVAITRAKSSLFILGHVETLERSDDTWRNIIQDARERSLIVNVEADTFTQPSIIPSIVPPHNAEPLAPPKKRPRISEPQISQSTISIPPDLVTPNALKESIKTSIPLKNPTRMDDPPNLVTLGRPNLKRRIGDEGMTPSASSSNPQGAPAQSVPRPPPPKKPKQEKKEMTMFISKSKKPGKP
ncbi:hypothetical protein FA15DRAFT_612773 [Coprinopsis marcescibilis]|uniref:Helicase sen1 n=1 Tax=Coprinopsis marcescibilis TaxID=230819 RepID=A0A5C3L781_COPMA|nr:hypothetical protein FA15DRAFT_612773 [Coprinopsis marcescibilis]